MTMATLCISNAREDFLICQSHAGWLRGMAIFSGGRGLSQCFFPRSNRLRFGCVTIDLTARRGRWFRG